VCAAILIVCGLILMKPQFGIRHLEEVNPG
jgi:hypothetical protein